MSRREAGLAELRRHRAARFDLKAIHLAKKESRKVPEKASNHVMAQMQEEMMNEKIFDCACLLTYSTKPKHISQATSLFEGLISKDYRAADCRRQLAVLLLLENQPRQAYALLKQAEGTPLGPEEGPCEGITFQQVLMWAYDQETEAREKAIREYKERVKAGFNQRVLLTAKAAHETKDDKAQTHAYASMLSRGLPEHQTTALYLFEGLMLQGYRKEACLSAMGLLFFMADKYEEAKMYLGEGLALLKEDDALKPVVASTLDWTLETMNHVEKLDAQRLPRKQQREKEIVLERKKREEERLVVLKQEEILRGEGKSLEEISKIMKEREEIAFANKKASEKAEQEKLAKERADVQAKQQIEEQRLAKEKDMLDINKAKAVGVRVCALERSVWEAAEAVRSARELLELTEANEDMKQDLARLVAEHDRAKTELRPVNEELELRLSHFKEVQRTLIAGGLVALRRALQAVESTHAAESCAKEAVIRCSAIIESISPICAVWSIAASAEATANRASVFAETADKARSKAVAASVECAVALADAGQVELEAKEETKRSPATAKKSSIRKPRPEHWVNGGEKCMDNSCNKKFTQLTRRHHCRNCGGVFCNECCPKKEGKDRLCRNCVLLVKS